MPKRKYQPDEKLESFIKRLKEHYSRLGIIWQDPRQDLSTEARMTITDLQKLKASSPFFCVAKWETVAPARSEIWEPTLTSMIRCAGPIQRTNRYP